MNKVIFILVLLCGCSTLQYTEPKEKKSLKQMLESGWSLHIYEGKKLVLIKRTEEELLVDDYFNTLSSEE